MSEAATLTPPGSVSLGARFFNALVDAPRRPGAPDRARFGDFNDQHPDTQALYESAAVTFVSRLTYAESVGVREALLSSVLLEALKEVVASVRGQGPKDGKVLARADAAIAVAEAA